TRLVYATRLSDRATCFTAAAMLLVLAVLALGIERHLRGSLHRGVPAGMRRNRAVPLGRWRLPALLPVLVVLGLGLVAPVASLAQWAWRGIDQDGTPLVDLGHALGDLAG